MGRPVLESTRTLDLPPAELFRLANRDGSVHVRTHSLPGIQVQTDIRAYAYETEAETAAERYVQSLLAVESSPGTVSVVTEPEDRPDAVDVQVDCTVLVPPGTDLEIESANGNVWVAEDCGRVTVQGRNTDIEVVAPRGLVSAQSMNGRIRVLDAVADTVIKTVNGNVYAHMKAGVLRADTTNGAIVAHRLDRGCRDFELRSQNGGITLVMNQGDSVRVQADTERGVVKCDLPVDASSGLSERRRLHGVIGKGDTTLSMTTLNGNIWIARAKT